jgi:hypothetical protein
MLTCSPQNNIHPFTQTSITSYVNPSFFNVLEVSYFKEGNVLGIGRIIFLSSPNNSIMKALLIP